MGQALYRKYRPKKLSEIVGEEHITLTLSNALKSNQISHAYLFTGPKGVGKTSVARILAHEINGFEYSDDNNHLDIIEIDAASNRRIDEIRQLRDRVNTAPSNGKYKVYIIDEVHMLTREAFNALLKTLEEPPEHAIFILATTESHKVPETIVSRTQQFSFRPIALTQIVGQLKNIAKKEKIDISDEALNIIAEYGQGSFRDSISLLDQVSSITNRITEKDLQSLLGMAPDEIINNLIISVNNGSIKDIADLISEIDNNGYNLTVICKQLISQLKNNLINQKSGLSNDDTLYLIKELIDVPVSNDPSTALEVLLIGVALKNHIEQEPLKKTKQLEVIEEKKEKPPVENKVVEEKPEAPKQEEKKVSAKQTNVSLNDDMWQPFLDAVKVKYNTLYGILRMAVPEFKGDEVLLKTKFDFHQRLLSDTKNQTIIIKIIEDISGQTVTIKSIVSKDVEIETHDERVSELIEVSQSITNINNIFGSSEVIE